MAKTVIAKQHVIDQALDKETNPANRTERLALALEEIPSVFETAHSPKPVSKSMSYDRITKEATDLTQDAIDHYHQGIQLLKMECDGANRRDGAGFSRVDLEIGYSLASALKLTQRQGVIAKKLCNKYRNQLKTIGFDIHFKSSNEHENSS